MRLNKNYAGISFLYRKGGAVSTVVELEMKDVVDGKYLQAAVDFSVARFPYFKSAILERGGDFFFAENEMPFKVTNTRERRPLGSQELNFHMLDITYDENLIFVSFHHALCDGLGIKRFIEALMCYYCQFKYDIHVEGGYGILPQPGDTLDPFAGELYEVDSNVEMPQVIRDGYELPEAPEKMASDAEVRHVFILDNPQFMAYAKRFGASPAVMVALMMSKAIKTVHPEAEKPILCNMASSLRQGLDAPHTLKNAVSSIYLPYDETLSQQPLEDQVSHHRRLISQQKEKNYIRSSANRMIQMFHSLEKLHTLEEKAAATAFFNDMKANSYTLSYLGRLDLEECQQYILSAQVYSSGNNGLLVNMMSVGNTISVEIIQSFENMCYVNEFAKTLEEADIPFHFSGQIPFNTPRDRVAETPALETVRNKIDKYAFLQSLERTKAQ